LEAKESARGFASAFLFSKTAANSRASGPEPSTRARPSVSSAGGSSLYCSIAALPLPVSPGQIAQNVYWGDYEPNMPSLLSAPAAGGPAVTLTSLEPMVGKSLAVDATTLYWVPFSSAVMGMPSGRGTAVTLANFPAGGNYPAIAVDATSLYWIHLDGAGQSGSVMKLTPK
jgi:hypothetical protein